MNIRIPRFNLNETLFESACKIDIINYMIADLYREVSPDFANSMFVNSCIYGDLKVAKILRDLGVYIYSHDNCAFRGSWLHGRVEVLKWLLTIGTFPNTLVNEYYEKHKICADLDKLIFDKGYVPLNKSMKVAYTNYIRRKIELGEQLTLYLIPDLTNLIYRFE